MLDNKISFNSEKFALFQGSLYESKSSDPHTQSHQGLWRHLFRGVTHLCCKANIPRQDILLGTMAATRRLEAFGWDHPPLQLILIVVSDLHEEGGG